MNLIKDLLCQLILNVLKRPISCKRFAQLLPIRNLSKAAVPDELKPKLLK